MSRDTTILGRQTKSVAKRRCHFCNKAVNFGYEITTGPCRGFFCGPRHARAANEHMEQLKKEKKNGSS